MKYSTTVIYLFLPKEKPTCGVELVRPGSRDDVDKPADRWRRETGSTRATQEKNETVHFSRKWRQRCARLHLLDLAFSKLFAVAIRAWCTYATLHSNFAQSGYAAWRGGCSNNGPALSGLHSHLVQEKVVQEYFISACNVQCLDWP